MIIYSGARRSGKTYKLVELLRNDPQGVLVEPNWQIADQVGEEYRLGVNVAAEYAYVHYRGDNPVNLYIDNLEMILKNIYGESNIIAASFTGKGLKLKNNPRTLDENLGL